jgi:hypothetical protein
MGMSPGTDTFSVPKPLTPVAYRTGVAAADVMALPGTITCTLIAGAGLTAGAYVTKIIAINAFGRTTPVTGSATITTSGGNLRINAAFAAVAGATHYGIYCSVAADPLWSGRITEAQRAAGVLLSTLGAGSAANSVDIDVIGTGNPASLNNAVNFAYVMPASPINCAGYKKVRFDITYSRTGDSVSPSLIVAPFVKNDRTNTWKQGQLYQHVFGGTAGLYNSNVPAIYVDIEGNDAVCLVVMQIAGTGAAIDVDVVLL